jgi:Tfp pilus assembly protein PilN
MRAINLIPVEARRGGGAPGRTGFVPYALVGLLAVLVIGALGWVLLDNQVKDRTAELAKTEIQATSTEAQATALKPYVDFAVLKAKRVQTVQQLISSRFDWDQILHDLSKAIPANAWLISFDGSATGTPSGGAAVVAATPTIKIAGCADSHDDVATMVTRMRLIRGVTRVSLESSERGDPGAEKASSASGGTATAATATGGCNGSKHPSFSMTIYFAGAAAPATGTGTTGTPGATPASTTTTTTPAQPGTSTTSTTTTTSSTTAVTSK